MACGSVHARTIHTIRTLQVQALVEDLLSQELRATWLKWVSIGLIVFTVLLLGAMTGLTWAVAEAVKDTEVDGDVLKSKGGEDTGLCMQRCGRLLGSGLRFGAPPCGWEGCTRGGAPEGG